MGIDNVEALTDDDAFTHRIGYQHQDMNDVGGPCPCNDTGSYVTMLFTDLHLKIQCWCGQVLNKTFESAEKRNEFIKKHLDAKQIGDV